MAIMIPDVAREFDPASLEGVMFDSLKKLPSDYYVVRMYMLRIIYFMKVK